MTIYSGNLSPFRYPGGKSKVAHHIITKYLHSYLCKADVYCEPFVGGGSIGCVIVKNAEYNNIKQFIFNDLDPFVSGFWQVIAKGSQNELCQLFKLIEQFKQRSNVDQLEHFYFLREQHSAKLSPIELAYHMLIFNRCTFSGLFTAGPIGGKNQQNKTWQIDCRWNPNSLQKTILALTQYFKHKLIVYQLNAIELINNFQKHAAMYIDPPYYKVGNSLYPIKFSQNEHVVLAEILKTRMYWVLSYDECVAIKKLYTFANIKLLYLKYYLNKKNDIQTGRRMRGDKNRREFIITPLG